MIINEKTLEWNYYLKKLPLYLQNSYGFSEHFKNLYQIMLDTNRTATDLLNALNLTKPNYFKNLNLSINLENAEKIISPSDYTYDLLDKMAILYGVSRFLDVDYTDPKGIHQHKQLKLTNDELLKLILVKVVQNNYNGTYEDMRKLYELIELPIYVFNSDEKSADVYLIYDLTNTSFTDNLQDLFFANLLSITSLGIKYLYRTSKEANWAEWDSTLDSKKWDVGVWV